MNVIEVHDVSKKFRLGAGTNDLRERFGRMFSRKPAEESESKEFWALQNINFSVEPGESFGIVGHNGSGKSTLLKLLTGIYAPTSGSFKIQGRVSALIEVGAGFHPDLTGRENVYLNGSVLGMKKKEIDRCFDQIVDFAELEQFIDTPVKRYSSGMYMRLGFAVAAHVDPDIVLVDEVLAVGDESFQKKCMKRMQDLRKEGKTIVFISHNMDAVAALCQKVMLLARGEIIAIGGPSEVISFYRTTSAQDREKRESTRNANNEGVPEMEILTVTLLNRNGTEARTFSPGDLLCVKCDYVAHKRIENPAFGVSIHRGDNLYISGVNTKFDSLELAPIEGPGTFTLTYSSLPLMQGTYHINVSGFADGDTHHSICNTREESIFVIESDSLTHGAVDIDRRWQFGRQSDAKDAKGLDGQPNGISGPFMADEVDFEAMIRA